MKTDYTAPADLPTRFGDFQIRVFTDKDGVEHMAASMGIPSNDCLVRVHSECATGDILGSWRCDCRDQLETSLQMIHDAGHGILIYMRGHEGRGIGLANKVKAYALQDLGLDTVDANTKLGFGADLRNYDAVMDILKFYGLTRIRLMTNNRLKMQALERGGIIVSEQVPIWVATNPYNQNYVSTKLRRMGHIPSDQAGLLDSSSDETPEQGMRVKRL